MIKIAHVAAEKIIDARDCYCPKPLWNSSAASNPPIGAALELRASGILAPKRTSQPGYDMQATTSGRLPGNGYTSYLVRKAHE